jgi:Fur family ferric uptake transcriptional regulator
LIKVAIRRLFLSCIPEHSKKLRALGYRMTPQRLAILEALHSGGHMTPGQIYDRLRMTGMTETTVYRTLDFLSGNGIVNSSQIGGGHLTYELARQIHHHHLVCRECGAQVDIAPGSIELAISQLEHQTGFQIDAGHLTFFGLCPACKRNHDPS